MDTMIGGYQLGKVIGEGTFGKVRMGVQQGTGNQVAVKILEKSRIVEGPDIERVRREIRILQILNNPNVVQVFEILEEQDHIYMIMQYANGGELFDYIVDCQRLKEQEACKFMHQIIEGVEYIHNLGVAHRDLKPENLLLQNDRNIVIVDFGLSNTFKDVGLLKTACGSPCYAAPEMIAGKQYDGRKTDIWSCGVILYAMLCGYLPFEEDNTQLLYKKILTADFHIPRFVSTDAKDLIRNILMVDPNNRFSIEQIKNHKWWKLYTSPSLTASQSYPQVKCQLLPNSKYGSQMPQQLEEQLETIETQDTNMSMNHLEQNSPTDQENLITDQQHILTQESQLDEPQQQQEIEQNFSQQASPVNQEQNPQDISVNPNPAAPEEEQVKFTELLTSFQSHEKPENISSPTQQSPPKQSSPQSQKKTPPLTTTPKKVSSQKASPQKLKQLTLETPNRSNVNSNSRLDISQMDMSMQQHLLHRMREEDEHMTSQRSLNRSTACIQPIVSKKVLEELQLSTDYTAQKNSKKSKQTSKQNSPSKGSPTKNTRTPRSLIPQPRDDLIEIVPVQLITEMAKNTKTEGPVKLNVTRPPSKSSWSNPKAMKTQPTPQPKQTKASNPKTIIPVPPKLVQNKARTAVNSKRPSEHKSSYEAPSTTKVKKIEEKIIEKQPEKQAERQSEKLPVEKFEKIEKVEKRDRIVSMQIQHLSVPQSEEKPLSRNESVKSSGTSTPRQTSILVQRLTSRLSQPDTEAIKNKKPQIHMKNQQEVHQGPYNMNCVSNQPHKVILASIERFLKSIHVACVMENFELTCKPPSVEVVRITVKKLQHTQLNILVFSSENQSSTFQFADHILQHVKV